MKKFIIADIPAGIIKNLKSVFGEKTAKKLLISSGKTHKHRQMVKTAFFDIWH